MTSRIRNAGYGLEDYELDFIPDGSLGFRCDPLCDRFVIYVCVPCLGCVVLQLE